MSRVDSKKYYVPFILLLAIILSSIHNFHEIRVNDSGLEPIRVSNAAYPLRQIEKDSPKLPQFKAQSYTSRNPIYISGNSDFATQAASEGWLGNGSVSAPFIIENYYITNSTASTHGIEIRSTGYNFILRNNYISVNGSSSSGIYLYFVAADQVLIENNTLVNNNYAGLEILYSDDVITQNNTISNNGNFGMVISGDSSLIQYNEISSHQTSGTNYGGIYLQGTRFSHIKNNNFSFNYHGIYSTSSDNATIEHNFFVSNIGQCIELSNSDWFNIQFNFFTQNLDQAIWVANAENNWITNNTFDGNFDAAVWISSFGYYSIIKNNTIVNNDGSGIWLSSYAHYTIISDNIIINNTDEGIRLSSTIINSTVTNNIIKDGRYGIYGFFEDTYIANNYIENVIYNGISITWSFNSTVENNLIRNCGDYGIDFYDSGNVTVRNNTVIGCTDYGIYVGSSEPANHIYLNNFLHNRGGAINQGYSTWNNQNWDNGTHGNFWLDYRGIDNNSDGIGDSPYLISGSVSSSDNFPLMIWYSIELPPEIIDPPSNLTYEEATIGHNLTWVALDESPFMFSILVDDIPVFSNLWTSREIINYSVDGLGLGVHNITIKFIDTDSNERSDTVFVTVIDTTPPNLNSGKIFVFMEVLPDKSINWTLTDLHPWNYSIFMDSVLYANGSWTSGQTITLNVTNLPLGVFEFIIYVNDSSSNINSSTHYVVIYDGTAPVVSHPTNFTHEYGYPTIPITWIANDIHPYNFTIFVDDQVYLDGNWTSDTNISLDYSDFLSGIYNITLLIHDTSALNATSTLFLTVLPDSTPPLITSPGNKTIVETTGTVITWLVTDYNPSHYTLYEDGIVVQSDSWNSSFPIQFIIANASIGIYNYTLVVFDHSNLSLKDSVFVIVEPVKGLAINQPENITYTEGMMNNWISWTIISNKTGNYTIYQDDLPLETDDWTNSTLVNYLVDNLDPGIYNFSIFVKTTDNLTVNDTVFVFVLIDSNPPLVSEESDIFILEMSINNTLTWTVADLNPDVFFIYKNDSLALTSSWVGNESLSIRIDGLHPGVWNYTIIVYDARGLSSADTVFVLVIDVTPPIIVNSPLNQTIEETAGSELTWRAIDYYPFNYTLILANGTIITGIWGNNTWINITIPELDLGNYTYTMTFSDLFGQESQSVVTIEVIDLTPPTINPHDDEEYMEGTTSYFLNWNISDRYNGTYIIYQDGEMLTSGVWNQNSSVSIDVGNLPAGTYTFSLVVTDFNGNQAIDTVILLVKMVEITTTTITSASSTSTSSSSSTSTPTPTTEVPPTTSSTSKPKVSIGFGSFSLLVLGIIFAIIRKKQV